MKNVNLLPPKLRPKKSRACFFVKILAGCFVVPGMLALVFFAMTTGDYPTWCQSAINKFTGLSFYESSVPRTSVGPTPFPASHPGETPGVDQQLLSSTDHSAESIEQLAGPQERSELAKPAPMIGATAAEPEHIEGYTLRLGLFIDADKSESLTKRLQRQGIRVFQQIKQEEKNMYTVFLDGFTTYEEGMIEARKLEKDLFLPKIEFQEQGVRVKIESFLTHDNAKELASRLKIKGYPVKITKELAPLTIYQVKSGPYATYREAKKTQLELEQEGFNSVILFKEQ